MKSAGYSSTPLAKKLGIKENFVVKLINEPDYYFDLFTDLPKRITVDPTKKSNVDFIHYFSTDKSALTIEIPSLKRQLCPTGMIWVSWYKKSAKIPTEITEDLVRNTALENGLVDIKVCAIDEKWSALKLVIPVKDRKK